MAEAWDPSQPAAQPMTSCGVPWLSVMGSLTPSVSSSGLENTTVRPSLRPPSTAPPVSGVPPLPLKAGVLLTHMGDLAGLCWVLRIQRGERPTQSWSRGADAHTRCQDAV